MITKYLVIGKHLYLQSKRPSSHEDVGTIVEITMPVNEYWELEEAFRRYEYLIATGEPNADIVRQKAEIFKRSTAYAVSEKDRTWMYDKLKEIK